MGKNRTRFFTFIRSIIAIMPILFTNCEGPSGPTGQTGPPSPVLTGTISGFVYLADPDTIYADHRGIEIQIENTTFTTSTDSNGRWSIDELPTGTYNILISKNGFGYFKYTSVQFIGGGEYYIGTRFLTSVPVLPVGLDSTITNPFAVIILGTLYEEIPEADYHNVLIFFGLSDSVSSNPEYYKYMRSASISLGSFSESININILKDIGFNSGDTIYITAFASISFYNYMFGGYVGYYYHRYIDTITGRYVYTHLGKKSNIVSFQLP